MPPSTERRCGPDSPYQPGLCVVSFVLPRSGPVGISADTEGGVWFAQEASGHLGHLDVSGKLTEYRQPDPAAMPWDVAVVAGELWFTVPYLNRVGRVRADGQVETLAPGEARGDTTP